MLLQGCLINYAVLAAIAVATGTCATFLGIINFATLDATLDARECTVESVDCLAENQCIIKMYLTAFPDINGRATCFFTAPPHYGEIITCYKDNENRLFCHAPISQHRNGIRIFLMVFFVVLLMAALFMFFDVPIETAGMSPLGPPPPQRTYAKSEGGRLLRLLRGRAARSEQQQQPEIAPTHMVA